jgi:hypothetical protein
MFSSSLARIHKFSTKLDGVELNKEFTSLIENDTLTVCKESQDDKRVFIATDGMYSTSTTTTSSIPLKSSQKPIIYFVTPTYPR